MLKPEVFFSNKNALLKPEVPEKFSEFSFFTESGILIRPTMQNFRSVGSFFKILLVTLDPSFAWKTETFDIRVS